MGDSVSGIKYPDQFPAYERDPLIQNRGSLQRTLDENQDGTVTKDESIQPHSLPGTSSLIVTGYSENELKTINSNIGTTANTAWATAGAATPQEQATAAALGAVAGAARGGLTGSASGTITGAFAGGLTAYQGAQSSTSSMTEMNMADPSNAQRLRAFGLTERQATNGKNMFFDLGAGKDGSHKYGFYSSGHGTGDERSGVLTVNKDGKFVGADGKVMEGKSLGADAWTKADGKDLESMKAGFDARDKAIQANYGGEFKNYLEAQKLRGQVGDLLGNSSLDKNTRDSLANLRQQHLGDKPNLDSAKAEIDKLKGENPSIAKSLLSTKLDEAESVLGKDAVQGFKESLGKEGAQPADIEKSLNEALTKATEARNKFDDQKKGEADIAAEVKKLEDGLKEKGSSLSPDQTKSFEEAQKSLKTSDGKGYRQDKEVLNELRLQNARLATIDAKKPPDDKKPGEAEQPKANEQPKAGENDASSRVEELSNPFDETSKSKGDFERMKLDPTPKNIPEPIRTRKEDSSPAPVSQVIPKPVREDPPGTATRPDEATVTQPKPEERGAQDAKEKDPALSKFLDQLDQNGIKDEPTINAIRDFLDKSKAGDSKRFDLPKGSGYKDLTLAKIGDSTYFDYNSEGVGGKVGDDKNAFILEKDNQGQFSSAIPAKELDIKGKDSSYPLVYHSTNSKDPVVVQKNPNTGKYENISPDEQGNYALKGYVGTVPGEDRGRVRYASNQKSSYAFDKGNNLVPQADAEKGLTNQELIQRSMGGATAGDFKADFDKITKSISEKLPDSMIRDLLLSKEAGGMGLKFLLANPNEEPKKDVTNPYRDDEDFKNDLREFTERKLGGYFLKTGLSGNEDPIIVLPKDFKENDLLHEIGHAVDNRLGDQSSYISENSEFITNRNIDFDRYDNSKNNILNQAMQSAGRLGINAAHTNVMDPISYYDDGNITNPFQPKQPGGIEGIKETFAESFVSSVLEKSTTPLLAHDEHKMYLFNLVFEQSKATAAKLVKKRYTDF